MNKFTKFLLGFLTILPIFYIIYFIWFVTFGAIGFSHDYEIVFILHGIFMLLIMALLAFYAIHLIKVKNIAQEQKIIWALVLFMTGIVGMPIYWYFNIWKENDGEEKLSYKISKEELS